MEYTTEQKSQLKTWAEERDLILSEISVNREKNEKLKKENIELSTSNTEISEQISFARGVLSVTEELEERTKNSISKDVSELKEKKAELEVIIHTSLVEIDELNKQKKDLKNDIDIISDIYKNIFSKLSGIESSIGDSSLKNSENIRKIEELFNLIKTKSEEIVSISTQNIEKHNVVLEKIPELFVELRRKSLEREEIKKTKHI